LFYLRYIRGKVISFLPAIKKNITFNSLKIYPSQETNNFIPFRLSSTFYSINVFGEKNENN